MLTAIDFTTIEVWTRGGLVTFYLLFVMELKTRRVHFAGCTPTSIVCRIPSLIYKKRVIIALPFCVNANCCNIFTMSHKSNKFLASVGAELRTHFDLKELFDQLGLQ